jgi:hypothetical protein
MQQAREALICDNKAAFEAAIQCAEVAVAGDPTVGNYLHQAVHAYPSPLCLASLASARMLVSHVR